METQTNKTHVIASIYDTKAEIYDQPRLFKNAADFVRACQTATKNPETMFNKFPADYDLVIIGEWDEKSAITSWEKKRLGSILDLCPLN